MLGPVTIRWNRDLSIAGGQSEILLLRLQTSAHPSYTPARSVEMPFYAAGLKWSIFLPCPVDIQVTIAFLC